MFFLLLTPAFACGAGLAAPENVTGTSRVGILLNISEGLLSATNTTLGISGFSFRCIGPDNSGFEIPFSVVINNTLKPWIYNSTSINIGSGYLIIKPLARSEFVRVNFLTGFNAAYYTYINMGNHTGPPPSISPSPVTPVSPAVTAPPTFSLGLIAGMEVEVPLGRLFSLPPDTICLAGGLSVNVSGSINIGNSGGKSYISSAAFSINTVSYGYSLNTLGIRSYF